MIHASNAKNCNGFTLVELMLSMTFVSILLISIAMLVIQISNIYSRGVTMKSVNQTGQSISSELQTAISQVSQFELDSSHYYIKYEGSKPVGARLCTGSYSYIWNHGKFMNNVAYPNATSLPNKFSGADVNTRIRFVKVSDSGASYCTPDAFGNFPDIKYSDSRELISSAESNLAMYSFSIVSNSDMKDTLTGQQLYYISYMIGTDSVALTDDTSSCRPPDDIKSDINYCSINDFNVVARAGNITN